MASGQELDLVIETGIDGITRIVSEPVGSPQTSAPSGVAVMGSPGACQDRAFHLLPFKWESTWNWWFQYRSTPVEIKRRAAENRLRSAVSSITGERNDCGRPDRVDATSRYRGRTTTRPGVNSDTNCGPFDDMNVVGFGTLPPGVLGLTCTRYQVDNMWAVESDVRFNKRWFGWSTSLATCDNQAMLRSIATHEFGHVFGLGHVRDDKHGNLTMSTAIGPCDDSAFTLGKGDMLGLEQRY
jgi:hypothetical protein